MPIIEKSQTQAEIDAGNAEGVKTRERLAEKIKGSDVFKDLNIPAEEVEETEEATTEETEEASTENTEEESQGEEGEEAAEEQDEDMVPKSKIQPRIDRLKAQIKALEAKVENQVVNQRAKDSEAGVDETTAKLRKMSNEELKVLRRDCRIAQAKNKDDDKKLAELIELEEKIDDTVREAPQRFVNAQVKAYNTMADKIAADDSIKNIEAAAPKIFAMAKEIYTRYPKLQSDVEGQAIALEIAADKYKELSKYSLTKGSVQNLKSQVNKLKAKTSLENTTSKSTGDSDTVSNLRKQASVGTTRDKIALFKGDPRFNVDAMIPVEYK